MHLPFTAEQFVEVFATYNAAVWPTQIVAYALGIAVVVLAFRRGSRFAGVGIAAILAGFWAFTGIGYHALSFAAINPVARVFGAAFVLQAVLFAAAGLRGKLSFRFAGDARSYIGLGMIVWSMVVYPAIGLALGHGFPNGPVFGLTPCPLAIFTFGMLLLADRAPRHLVVLPLLWACIGTSAAVTLGILEDVSLGLSGVAGTALVLTARRAERPARHATRLTAAAQS